MPDSRGGPPLPLPLPGGSGFKAMLLIDWLMIDTGEGLILMMDGYE